jgi:splicing factor 45
MDAETYFSGRYDELADRWQPSDEVGRPRGIGSAALIATGPPPSNETGEEAYQRRLALSQAAMKSQTGDEVYQRRLALSQSASTFAPPNQAIVVGEGPMMQDEEDLPPVRGLGFLASATMPLPASGGPSGTAPSLPPFSPPMLRTPPFPPPNIGALGTPPFPPPGLAVVRSSSPPDLAFNPFAPPTTAPPPPSALPPSLQDQIAAKRNAAAAIAAKLAALATTAGTVAGPSAGMIPTEQTLSGAQDDSASASVP